MLPCNLISDGDDERTLELFAELLRQAEAPPVQRWSTPPAPLWLLTRQAPSPDDLLSLCNGHVPSGWPSWFARNQTHFVDTLAGDVFRHCVSLGPSYGICEGTEFCRLMGAVSQTLYSTNEVMVRRNRRLAKGRSQSPWTGRELYLSRRPDEQGGCLSAAQARLWMASHIGPRTTQKTENQDAVYAAKLGNGFCFALADGVTTSLGSRYAAAVAAFDLCQEMRRTCADGTAMEESKLLTAAQRTQQGMEAAFQKVQSDWSSAEGNAVLLGSALQTEAIQMILENTATGDDPYLQPAMATTLLGGYLLPAQDGQRLEGAILCIGDGAVEIFHPQGNLQQLLVTDPDQTGINAWMGPGPGPQKILEHKGVRVCPLMLEAGDYLLLSSDGLARGHAQPVWGKVQELLGDIRTRLEPGRADTAAVLLRDLVAVAERSEGSEEDSRQLFADNLSLLLVSAGE